MKKTLIQAMRVTGLAFLVLSLFGASQSFAGGNFNAFKLPANITAKDYMAGTIVVKVKPEFRNTINDIAISNGAVQAAFSTLQVSSFEKRFPHSDPPEREYNSWGAKLADLTRIYEIHYSATTGIEDAISKLIALGVFEYVEPRYIDRITYSPNDPDTSTNQRYWLTTIHAYQAFDITKGDTGVVIGIVDSGTDTLHPDLAANIKINYADPPDGIDNDGDGYIDNTKGWDVAENKRTVQVVSENHGSAVSGDADAVTDNGVGVASPGFKCKFLPVKSALDASTGSIDNGYGGIVYAANHGCKIINCSWGGASGFSQAGQDVITYATINKDALVVCAAGNDGLNESFYPAQYQYVLNVAATQNGDGRANFSNYGPWVTISAPGNLIFSTIRTNVSTYQYSTGTSMASPITAGAAAIVKSKFPSYNALQIKAQLMATADNIDAQNPSYIGQLGAGRLNMFRAVTETNHKAVNMVNIAAADNNDNIFVIGDTLRISGHITNYLAPTTNLTVTMSSSSPYVTIQTSTVNVGAMSTMAVDSTFSPFTAKIKAGTPLNSTVTFLFTMTDGSYTSTVSYSVIVNVDYLNVNVNDVSTSQTSHSLMAYNDPDLSTRVQGLGFIYRDSSMTYEIGFMAGTDASHTSDDIRTGGAVSTTDNDFATSSIIKQVTPSVIADFESYGKFSDAAAAAPINILVTHHTMAWKTSCDRKYVIVEYYIKNIGTSAINNLYAGMFADWDIGPSGQPDKGNVDAPNKLGYIYENGGGGFYAGIKLLTNGAFNHYAIDNDTVGGASGVHPYYSFTKAEKFATLSTSKNTSGTGNGHDVSQVVSTGPFNNIAAGDSVIVAFAFIAGDNLADITNSATEAQLKYANPSTCDVGVPVLEAAQSSLHIYPNPAGKTATVNFSLDKSYMATLSLYNTLGEKVKLLFNSNLSAGSHSFICDLTNLPAGTYYLQLRAGDKSETQKLLIIK